MNETGSTTEISSFSLIKRINRKLAIESQNQKESHMGGSPSFGHFYAQSDRIPERSGPIDIESIARELGVLKPGETIKE